MRGTLRTIPFAGLIALMAMAFASTAHAQTHLTHSTNNTTVTPGVGIACTAGGIINENGYWRAYNLSTLMPGVALRVEAIRVGIEVSSFAANTFEIRLYTNSGGAFPAGTLTQQGSTQTVVEPSAGAYNNSIQVFPLTTPVLIAAGSELVVEFRVLDNSAGGGSFYPGSNQLGESSPSYITAPTCGVTSPVTMASVGFTMHMILDVLGNGPEMDVQRPASTSIADGGTHDLGSILAATPLTFTFTIENTGLANLLLPSAISLTAGTGSPSISVVSAPAASVGFTAGSNTTTFDIQVTAPVGNFDFTLSLASGSSPLVGLDFNENPYNFTVTGVGISNSPPVVSVPATGSNWVDAGGGLFTLTLQPGATINDALNVDDATPDNMTVDVTAPATSITGLTGEPVDITTPTPGTIALTWIGTADANNVPGSFDWDIDIDDGVTVISITARIIIVDTAPQHAPATGVSGDGSVGTPYLAQFAEGNTVSINTVLAQVTDQNTGQTISLGTVTRTGGTASGGSGFTYLLSGTGDLSVEPAATLIAADVGTNIYTVVVTDGTNPVTINVTITVIAQTPPTFTPGTGVSIAQGTSQTGVVVGVAADGQDPFSALNVAATNVPTGVTVSAIAVNATNGEVTATITVSTASTAGAALIEFTVTDTLSATGSDDYSFTIVANTLPVITAGSAISMGTSASLTNRIIADVSDAEDAAGTLTVSVVTAPAGVAISAIVNTAGEVRATITTTAATVGANIVVLQVTDSNGASSTANYTVNVSTGGGSSGGGGGGGDGGGGCAASGSSSSLWLALFGLMAVAAMGLRVRRSRA